MMTKLPILACAEKLHCVFKKSSHL